MDTHRVFPHHRSILTLLLGIIYILVILSLALSPTTIKAQTSSVETEYSSITTGETVILNNLTIERDTLLAGRYVLLSSTTIDGDLFIVAQDINIKDSQITGDLFLFSRNATLENTKINASVYSAAQIFSLKNTQVGRSVYWQGQVMQGSVNIGRDLYANGQNINLTGTVARDAKIAANSIGTDTTQSLTIKGEKVLEVIPSIKETTSLTKYLTRFVLEVVLTFAVVLAVNTLLARITPIEELSLPKPTLNLLLKGLGLTATLALLPVGILLLIGVLPYGWLEPTITSIVIIIASFTLINYVAYWVAAKAVHNVVVRTRAARVLNRIKLPKTLLNAEWFWLFIGVVVLRTLYLIPTLNLIIFSLLYLYTAGFLLTKLRG